MDLPIIDETEFDEADVLYAHGSDDEEEQTDKNSPSDVDSSVDFGEDEKNSPPGTSMDIAPSSMKTGSARSDATPLEFPEEEDRMTSAFHGASGHAVYQSQTIGMACSMPVKSHISMGSSIPMNIPMYRPVWKAEKASTAATDTAYLEPITDGFIPPHEMSQSMAAMQHGFAFSLATGESMASMKRERLRARTAILKSTGFLEKSADGAPPPGHGGNSDLLANQPFIHSAGGLSKALGALQ